MMAVPSNMANVIDIDGMLFFWTRFVKKLRICDTGGLYTCFTRLLQLARSYLTIFLAPPSFSKGMTCHMTIIGSDETGETLFAELQPVAYMRSIPAEKLGPIAELPKYWKDPAARARFIQLSGGREVPSVQKALVKTAKTELPAKAEKAGGKTEEPLPAKRGPGRPPKAAKAATTKKEKQQSVKRGPGRPPKAAKAAKAIKVKKEPLPVKRGPGRPKKEDIVAVSSDSSGDSSGESNDTDAGESYEDAAELPKSNAKHTQMSPSSQFKKRHYEENAVSPSKKQHIHF